MYKILNWVLCECQSRVPIMRSIREWLFKSEEIEHLVLEEGRIVRKEWLVQKNGDGLHWSHRQPIKAQFF